MPPTVAVIVPTYNRTRYLGQALDSLLGQTRPPDEVIVVDDGSTDDTAERVADYGERVRYMYKANGGKSAALNWALESLDSDYVWLFDDDDIALPDALASHLDFLAKNPGFDFSYSSKYVFSGEFSLAEIRARPTPRLSDASPEAFFVHTMEAMHTMMQGMLIPLRCYKAVGPFDETLLRAQDHDMLLRLARRFRAGPLGQPTFALRRHDGARGPGHATHAEKNRSRVWERYRQQIFTALRERLALVEYLPSGPAKNEMSSAEYRQALLQRGCIMAKNSLYESAMADFKAWRAAQASAPRPSAAEARIFTRIAQIEDMSIAQPPLFYWQFSRLAGRNTTIRAALLRGLYWSAVRELEGRRYRGVLQIAKRAVLVVGGTIISA